MGPAISPLFWVQIQCVSSPLCILQTIVLTNLLVALTALGLNAPLDEDPTFSAPAAPYRIAANLYAVGTKGIGCYLLTTPKGHILIDGSTQAGATIIENNIRKLGFKLQDIKVLLATHAHFDHVGGLAKLKLDTGAKFFAMKEDVWSLEHGQHDSDTNYGPASYPPIKVDRILKDGSKVGLGGLTLVAHHIPGHTKGCTSWTMSLRDPSIEGGKRLSVMFFGSATVAGNILVGNRAYPGIASDFRRSFRKLRTFHPDIFLANHPSFADMDEKKARLDAGQVDAFVDRKGFPQLVEELRLAFEKEFARQKKAKVSSD